jgi:DNA-binding transcriptional LysR family regulator
MRHHTTFRQLEIFEAIARLGSFTRASEELYLTQPTVSMQMKKLTDIVGAPLVEQVGKKVLLTEDGRELAQASRDIFAILDRYTMAVAERQGLERGKLKLMAITTASYFAPRLLGDFAKLHPGIDVSLRVTNKEQVLASMADNLDDLYLLGTPPEEIDVIATPIMDNPIVVLAAPDHPLAREKSAFPSNAWRGSPGSCAKPAPARARPSNACSMSTAWKSAPAWNWAATRPSSRPSSPTWAFPPCPAMPSPCTSPTSSPCCMRQGFPIQRHWYAVYPAGRQISVVARAFLDFLLGQRGGTSCVPGGGQACCGADCRGK